MKAGGERFGFPGDLPKPRAVGAAQYQFEQAVVGADIPATVGFNDNGAARVPGDGRLARRAKAEREGVTVARDLLDKIEALAG